jgi:dipeptide/tripeptide permease
LSSPPFLGSPQAEHDQQFYVATYRRLIGTMVALALAGAPVAWMRYGRSMALVFLLGSAIALLNFYWLRRSLEAMGRRLESSPQSPSRAGIVARFLLRYLLIALAAYAILKSTASSLNGLFAGLSLPVGAILTEAVYQLYTALRAQTLNPRN